MRIVNVNLCCHRHTCRYEPAISVLGYISFETYVLIDRLGHFLP